MGRDEGTVVVRDAADLARPATRRAFLRAVGLGGTAVLLPSVFAACADDGVGSTVAPAGLAADVTSAQVVPVTLDLSTDIGIFNYAYALEQLEAAFYTQVAFNGAFNSTFSADEREVLREIWKDEVAHREFFRAALGAAAIPGLTPNFAGVNFANRLSVLQTARTFEDLGVAAYNGAGRFVRNGNNLLMAGKIVSVEARHAAAIRDVLDPNGISFADLGSLTSLGADPASARDGALPPAAVLAAAQPFVNNPITIGRGPTTI